jgi:hypothetical protein
MLILNSSPSWEWSLEIGSILFTSPLIISMDDDKKDLSAFYFSPNSIVSKEGDYMEQEEEFYTEQSTDFGSIGLTLFGAFIMGAFCLGGMLFK